MKQEKRHKLQLYYAILCAIEEDVTVNRIARPTRVQHYSRLSYDKMMNHLIELEQKEMIYRTSDGLVSITSKGKKFIRQYDDLINLLDSAGI